MGMVQNPLMLLLLVVTCRVAEADVTCQASTTFEETSVTCNFGKDLSESSHNFNVQFFYPNLQADPPETVLMCNWKTSSDLQCKKARDVRFDKNVTDRVTFHRDQSVRKAGGKYVCQVVPSIGDDVVPCMLVFKGDLPTSTRPTTTTTTQSLLLGEIRSLTEMTLVVSIVALIVVFILLIFLLIYCCRRRIAEKVPVLAKVLGQGREEKETHNVEEGKAVEEDPTANEEKPKIGFWGRLWSRLNGGNQAREEVPMLPSDKNEKGKNRSDPDRQEPAASRIEAATMPLVGKNRSDPARQEPAASGIEAATMPLVMSSGRSPDNSSAEKKPENDKERKAREKKEKKERAQKEKEDNEKKKKEEKERKKRDSKHE